MSRLGAGRVTPACKNIAGALSTNRQIPRGANMSALAIVETTGPSLQEWLDAGRAIMAGKRNIEWQMADWLVQGRDNFPDQMALALPNVSDDPRNLKRIEKTARAFPPHLRSASLSFDHHAHVADMPVQEALPLLREAEAEKLPARKFRIRAMLHKVDSGQILVREDDAEYDALVACVRAWNRAQVSVRQDFAEMVAGSAFAEIEP